VSASADVHYVILASAGSAGLPFAAVAERLDAAVIEMPDASDVRAMADALAETIESVPRPRVLVGASLGAMVALECARAGQADGLVLIAAGFGIVVGDEVLDWVAANPPDLLAKMAAIGLANATDEALVATRAEDFATRGQPVLLRHLQALAAYRPDALPEPPPTLVMWGERDRGVPLADHAELARRCGGVLVPIEGAGHAPFLEQPEATARWIRWLGEQVGTAFPEVTTLKEIPTA
jgi:pimeloyl-ACP methyl ester carboxylesterase